MNYRSLVLLVLEMTLSFNIIFTKILNNVFIVT